MDSTRTTIVGSSPLKPIRSEHSPFRKIKQRPSIEERAEADPSPTRIGTIIFLTALATAGFAIALDAKEPARIAAIITLIGFICSAFVDFWIGGLRNLARTDLFAILALYFLTFFEFLFPQPEFYQISKPFFVKQAVILVLWCFAGMAIGRHFSKGANKMLLSLFTSPVPPGFMLSLFWFVTLVGYLHMLVAVKFNVVEMVNAFFDPRFTQPWTRGRLGDWKALLVELGLFLYLIPPLAGVIFAWRSRYPKFRLWLVGFMFAFTMFYGFTTGTRNIFASYLLTFCMGYAFALPASRRKELIPLSIIAAVVMVFATIIMLEFRTVGIKNYLQKKQLYYQDSDRTLFVDYNLHAISQLVEVFPERHDYLGLEIPFQALIRPIPRAIWKGKPEGLSMSIEEAVNAADETTVAASMVGEAYMSGGLFGVILAGFIFGMITGWWGRLASPRNSDFGNLVYASGFFAAAISMRSLFTFTTAILPTVAALSIGILLIEREAIRRGKASPFRKF